MIDNPDVSKQTIKLLAFQALKSYSTRALLPMLLDDDFVVRSAVARELQTRGEKIALAYVFPLCRDDRAFVREIAAFTLGQLGTPTYPFRSESIPMLIDLANDISLDVRLTAIAALGHLHAIEGKDVLLKSAVDTNPDVREMAAFSLGRMDSSMDVLQTLKILLQDPSSEVRESARDGIDLLS